LKSNNGKLYEAEIQTSVVKNSLINETHDFEEMQEIPEEYHQNNETYESLNNIISPLKKISAYQISPSKKLSDKGITNKKVITVVPIVKESKAINFDYYSMSIVKNTASRNIMAKKEHLNTQNNNLKAKLEIKKSEDTHINEEIKGNI